LPLGALRVRVVCLWVNPALILLNFMKIRRFFTDIRQHNTKQTAVGSEHA